jgi:hypothetical protein
MHIEIKKTCWESIILPEDITENQIEKIKELCAKPSFNFNDMMDILEDHQSVESNNCVEETENYLETKENGDYSTTVLYDNNIIIAQNGIE